MHDTRFWLSLFLGLPPVLGLGLRLALFKGAWLRGAADDSGGNVRPGGLPPPNLSSVHRPSLTALPPVTSTELYCALI